MGVMIQNWLVWIEIVYSHILGEPIKIDVTIHVATISAVSEVDMVAANLLNLFYIPFIISCHSRVRKQISNAML